ncbi:MAG: hypothetical protein KDD15_29075 [Lewinella sp.]|nr:hypothetical protein [Lewinella sp.]
MDYENAKRFKEDFEYLVGDEYKGAIIEELIVVPAHGTDFNEFVKIFLRTEDPHVAIIPFLNRELTVEVLLDKHKIDQGYFLHGQLPSVLSSLGIEYDISDYQ